MILDLRFNNGGSVELARYLAASIAGTSHRSNVFMRMQRNSGADEYIRFGDGDDLNLKSVRIICSEETASASELIISGLRGIDFPVKLFGSRTEGKNVGMEVQEYKYGNKYYEFAPITFRSFNAKDWGDYADGIDPDVMLNNQNSSYEDDIDNIVGVLYLKDVIDAYLNQKEAKLSDIAREPFFVHQTMNLSVLFQEMQTKKIHMAIVIDEYSQTEGIVSMEDMLEVIVGNILDEYDVEDRNITKIGWADVYLVRGSTRLEELEDTLGIEFDVEDIETLNGFLIDQLGHLPEDNEEIEIIYQGYSFKSVDIHDNMIRQVKVEKRKRKEEKDVRTQ